MTSRLSDSIDDPQLRESVERLITAYPDSFGVIRDLISYYSAKLSSLSNDTEEREHKKRRIDSAPSISSFDIIATIPEVSCQIPARKKYNLIVSTTHLVLVNSKTNEVEHQYPLNEFQLGTCVPSPGPTKAFVFSLFLAQPDTDPLVFTVSPKYDIIPPSAMAAAYSDGSDETPRALIALLMQKAGIRMITQQRNIYVSSGTSATTGKPSDEDRFHANAYLKAREGSLYFLPQGILYGFKKPTVFFPLDSIASTVFRGITQRTFDLVVSLKPGRRPLGSSLSFGGDDGQVEFSMIEHTEYPGINDYIQKLKINDKSMSEENRAPEAAKAASDENGRRRIHADEDEENDLDFRPSDQEEDPLEYDSEAIDDEDEEMGTEEDQAEEEENIQELEDSENDENQIRDTDEEEDGIAEERDQSLNEEEDDLAEDEEEEEMESDPNKSESLGSSDEVTEDEDEDIEEELVEEEEEEDADDARDELDESD